MFKPGDRIHTHDGKVHRVRSSRSMPRSMKGPKSEMPRIRGFVRGALVDCLSGEVRQGDWHENVITTYGHGIVIKNFIGSAGSTAASWWGIGWHNNTSTSNYSTMSAISSSEYGSASTNSTTGTRVVVSSGMQTLSGTWSLSQSLQIPSSCISHAVTIDCVAQYNNSSLNNGTALSLATFASSTKGTTQALNITYNWLFSTVFLLFLFIRIVLMSQGARGLLILAPELSAPAAISDGLITGPAADAVK